MTNKATEEEKAVKKQGISDLEAEKEAKRTKTLRRNSRGKSTLNAAKGAASAICAASTLNPAGAISSGYKTIKRAYKESKYREREVYNKAKVISKKRLDAFEELFKGNEVKDKALGFVINEWKNCKGWNKLAKKVAAMKSDDDFIPLQEVQDLIDKNPQARDQLQAKIQDMVDTLPQKEKFELLSVMFDDGKTKAAMQATLLKEALNEHIAPQKTKEQSKVPNIEKKKPLEREF